jgi:hypothetical protein
MLSILLAVSLFGAALVEARAGGGSVTGIQFWATPERVAALPGSQVRITFVARITTDGPCVVRYRWSHKLKPETLWFAAAGSQDVSSTAVYVVPEGPLGSQMGIGVGLRILEPVPAEYTSSTLAVIETAR